MESNGITRDFYKGTTRSHFVHSTEVLSNFKFQFFLNFEIQTFHVAITVCEALHPI